MDLENDDIELPEAWWISQMTRRTSPMTRRTSPMTPSVVISKVWGLYIWDDKLMITEMKMSRMKMKRVSQYSGGLREAIQVNFFSSEGSL